ncbi:MAG: TonB-dependent receptor [Acidobacteria bacterium]|nr:TonB-dependent receptor [Acidobacteriota bacterium]
MKLGSRFFIFTVVCLGLCAIPLSAQKITGDITGNVNDQSGAAVPKATVTAENTATKLTRTTTTSDSGVYRLTELPPGTYKLSVTAAGFKTVVREAIVATAQTTDSDFTLQVGERTETITVEASAPLIEFNDKLNSYVNEKQVVDLPLVGRDFNSLLGITPGVQRAPGGGFLAVSINGNRPFNNNYLIDGMYNNDRYYGDSLVGQTGVLGIPATVLPNDAIQEFTVQQLPSAEYGIKGGAAINVQLKSGGNNLHGGVYGFFLTDFGSANSPIHPLNQAVNTPIHNYQYGGNVGGPLVKDKTFYFGFIEGQRNKSNPGYTRTVPTQGEINLGRSIAAAALGVAPTAPMPGDAILALFPRDPSLVVLASNATRPTIAANIPNIANSTAYSIKIDHKMGTQHSLSGRYYIADSFQSAPTAGYQLPAPGRADMFNSVAPSRAQLLGVGWTYTMATNKILESRFGWSRFSQIIDVNNKIDPRSLGLDTGPLDPLDFGVPYVYAYYVSNGYIGGVAGYPITTRPNQTFDQSEHFTWIKGNHTFKMGGNWQYASTFSIRNRSRSSLVVAGYTVPDSISQILTLRFGSAARNFGSTNRHIFQHSFGFYFQDDWKVRPRLTISYGLRYEISTALGENDKQGANFDPVLGLVNLGPTMKALHDKDLNNFGPRAGLAWDIFGNGKTALRVGYALTYDQTNFGAIHAPQAAYFNGNRTGAFTNITQNNFSKRAPTSGILGAPTVTAANLNDCFDINGNAATWVCAGPGHTIYGANPTGAPPFNAFGVVRNFKVPMFHNYQVSIQQELLKNTVLTVSYVGSKGRQLPQVRALNARPIGCFGQAPIGPCARPFDTVFQTGGVPTFLQVNQLTNDGESDYSSLQVSLRQQNWHGITTQYNFTWGHCIDLGSNNRGGGRTNSSPFQNPYRPEANRGNCDHDVRRNFNAGGTYTIPFPKGWGRVTEGWEIGTVITLLDGRPFTANIGSRDRTGQGLSGNNRADCLSKPVYHTRTPGSYVEGAAFAQPANNQVGSCGRNSLRGPGLAQVDMSVIKTTRLTEKFKVQFRWELTNAFNRANFGFPVSNIRSSDFGVISSTPDIYNPVISQGGPRAMQWVVKFLF